MVKLKIRTHEKSFTITDHTHKTLLLPVLFSYSVASWLLFHNNLKAIKKIKLPLGTRKLMQGCGSKASLDLIKLIEIK